MIAAGMGMAFLAVFMLLYYRLSGLNAIVALTANIRHPPRRDGLLRARP